MVQYETHTLLLCWIHILHKCLEPCLGLKGDSPEVMERIARSHFNVTTNEEQSPNLSYKNSLLLCQSFPTASFLWEASVLSSLVPWESLSNRLEITHLPSFIMDGEVSEQQQCHLVSNCSLDVGRPLPDLLDSGTCRLVQMWKTGLETHISLFQLIPDLWDMKKKIREHW